MTILTYIVVCFSKLGAIIPSSVWCNNVFSAFFRINYFADIKTIKSLLLFRDAFH